jgi:hypothetical protein
METIECKCTYNYHPVGQGLFYSGRIYLPKSDFNFVYDCGTNSKKSYLTDEINSLNNGKLDLLIISHFHKDHISGIPELLTKFKDIKTVVLPYITEIERLIFLAKFHLEKPDENNDPFFNAFYTDPSAFFTEKKCNAIFIRSAQEPQPIIHEVETTEFNWNSKQILSNYFYEFLFYSKPMDPNKLKSFSEHLNVYGLDKLSCKEIIDTRLNDLKSVYNEVFDKNNLNHTSLLCYHGPKQKYPRALSQLLTGDILFTSSEFDEFIKFLSGRTDKVAFATVPHHGSKHNWFIDSDKANMYLDNLPLCVFYVVSFGLGNKDNFPSSYVVDEITKNNRCLKVVNQLQGCRICFCCFVNEDETDCDFKDIIFINVMQTEKINIPGLVKVLSYGINKMPLYLSNDDNCIRYCAKQRLCHAQ